MTRSAVLTLSVLTAIFFAITTAVAYFINWLPTPASREAGRIYFTYWFATWIAIFVFAVVCAVLTYCFWKFRADDDDLSDGPPTHGHTTLEIVWTAIPFVLVTAISIVSAIVLAQNSDAGSNPLRIKVVARQFTWEFTYPNKKAYPYMVVPINRKIELSMTSNDVIHSFYVPHMAQKQDVVPGVINKLVITPDRLGTFDLECTELCGLGHAWMRSSITVLSVADYDYWFKNGKFRGSRTETAGKQLFDKSFCSACHTFTLAGANQKVGPDLDDLQAEADNAGVPLEDFIRESITDPAKYIENKYPCGGAICQNTMPPDGGANLSSTEVDLLVQYLLSGSTASTTP